MVTKSHQFDFINSILSNFTNSPNSHFSFQKDKVQKLKKKLKMKCSVLVAFLLCSLVAVLCSTDVIYEPEYEPMEEVRSVRTKRSPHGIDPASLAFLGGVAAGGIFGPILYNKLYGGWGGSSYSSGPSVHYQASSGWEPPRGW